MKNSSKDILLLTLGGTIESHYNPEEGTPATVPMQMEPVIAQAMQHLGLANRCQIHPICMEDSKDISPDDLRKVTKIIADHQAYSKAIVVQGTDTMPINARKCQQQLEKLGVTGTTIVFTGAMEPLRDKQGELLFHADGWANLKRAVEAADAQPAGAYVVINDECHKADDISKYVKTDGNGMVEESGFVPRLFSVSEG